MSDMKADMSRVEPHSQSPLSTAPPAIAQVKVSEGRAVDSSGKSLPDETVVKAAEPADDEAVENAVSKLNEYVQNTARTLNFQVDDESGKTVIKVYDRESDQLIRQIPNELVLELARKLNEEEPSLLFEAQV